MAKIKQKWINWRSVIIDDPNLSFHAKALALYLNTYMNDSHDMAFPSVQRIKGDMNLGSYTTVKKYLTELEEKGYLSVNHRFGKTNIYTAQVPESIVNTSSITPDGVLHEMERSITRDGTPVLHEVETNKQENKQSNKQDKGKLEKWAIPDWVNPNAWLEFEQHRKEIKKPMSRLAKTKAANQLKGYTFEEQQAAIDKSIQSRWAGIFPEKLNETNQRTSNNGNGQTILTDSTDW